MWFIRKHRLGEKTMQPHQVLGSAAAPGLLQRPLIVRGMLLGGLSAAHTRSPQQNVCASKEDTILGRPNKEAAGVWDSLSRTLPAF